MKLNGYICADMETIIYIGLAQSIFSSILIMMKKPKLLSDKLMGTLIALFGFQLLARLLGLHFDDLRFSSSLFFKGIPFAFGPLLYLYVKKLSSDDQKMGNCDWKHFYVVFTVPVIRFFFLVFPDLKASFGVNEDFTLFGSSLIFYAAAIISHLGFYLVATYRTIQKFEKNIKNSVSYDLEKINLQWVKTINYLFLIGTILAIVTLVYSRLIAHEKVILTKYISAILFTVFSYGYSLFAFRQQGIHERTLLLEKEETKEKPKYERSGLKEEEADNYVKKLLDFMRIKKAFLRNDLTIEDISTELDISRHYLTEILNTKLNRNFYNFVNEYRIKEFKEELFHPDNKNLTISAIAFKCGFNSKSSFQKMFKKIEGITPSEFRNKSYS